MSKKYKFSFLGKDYFFTEAHPSANCSVVALDSLLSGMLRYYRKSDHEGQRFMFEKVVIPFLENSASDTPLDRVYARLSGMFSVILAFEDME